MVFEYFMYVRCCPRQSGWIPLITHMNALNKALEACIPGANSLSESSVCVKDVLRFQCFVFEITLIMFHLGHKLNASRGKEGRQ